MKRNKSIIYITVSIIISFIIILGSLKFCYNFISSEITNLEGRSVVDLSLTIGRSISLSDSDVEYLKSLTFNEMEHDDLNKKMIDFCTGINYQEPIISVYVVAPMSDEEIKYYVDSNTNDFFMQEEGTPLNAIWLLNIAVDQNGDPVYKEREDVYHYTVINKELRQGFDTKKPFSICSADEWGEVMTGYSPIYSNEGNFIGMIGVDMNVTYHQNTILNIVGVIIAIFFIVIVVLLLFVLMYYFKYTRIKLNEIYTDSLTKIFDRRYFNELFYKVLYKKSRSKKYIGLAMADLDNFKQINDTYGHEAGDKYLKEFGTVLRDELYEQTELITRYGGDEFVFAYVFNSKKEFEKKLNSIIDDVANMDIGLDSGSITVSIGATCFNSKLLTEKMLSEKVLTIDKNLYKAKINGKNSYFLSDDLEVQA